MRVTADPRRLRQVVDGLAENALRVTPAGAPLAFAVFPGGVLQVRDGGPGLAPEDYAVVFDRGALHERYRGHRPVGVGGVGLALVHGLVTRMGGTITAEPAPEGGACYPVSLPRPSRTERFRRNSGCVTCMLRVRDSSPKRAMTSLTDAGVANR